MFLNLETRVFLLLFHWKPVTLISHRKTSCFAMSSATSTTSPSVFEVKIKLFPYKGVVVGGKGQAGVLCVRHICFQALQQKYLHV